MCEPKRRVVSSDSGWNGIEETYRGADERRADHREDDLSDGQGRAANEYGDNERPDDARAAVEDRESRGRAREEWERVDREREQ